MAEDTADTAKTDPGAPEREDHKSEVEILATALADSSKNASASNTATVRVLGVLLAFSVLGNIALAGLNIKGNFFGTDIEMGGADALNQPMLDEPLMDEEPEEKPLPPEEWCAEIAGIPETEVHPEDLVLCQDLYPYLWE